MSDPYFKNHTRVCEEHYIDPNGNLDYVRHCLIKNDDDLGETWSTWESSHDRYKYSGGRFRFTLLHEFKTYDEAKEWIDANPLFVTGENTLHEYNEKHNKGWTFKFPTYSQYSGKKPEEKLVRKVV